MMRYLLSFLCVTFHVTHVQAAVSYVKAFKDMQPDIVWPCPDTPRQHIASTFGPRIHAGDKRPDFHRGIDVHGEVGHRVVAAYRGVVNKITTYESGGLCIILKHEFPEWTTLIEGHPTTKMWYSLHYHMDSSLVEVGDVVNAGDLIGIMGQSGKVSFPHLHWEIRVGSRCGLEYAVTMGDAQTCNTKYYDPHVHPLFLVEHLTEEKYTTPEVTMTAGIGPKSHAVFHVVTADAQPDINYFHLDVISALDMSIKASHTLDLSTRAGFDATSTVLLDMPNDEYPWLMANTFGRRADTWDIDYIVPAHFIGEKVPGDIFRFVTANIWGDQTVLHFGDTGDQWKRGMNYTAASTTELVNWG